MTVAELRMLLAAVPDATPVLIIQDGEYWHVIGERTEVVPDPTKHGYARPRAPYRTAEREDTDLTEVVALYLDC